MAPQYQLVNPARLFVIGACALIAVGIQIMLKYYFASQRPKNFPPGPPTIPFLGNLGQLPKTKLFLKFVSLLFQSSLIVINFNQVPRAWPGTWLYYWT